MPRILALLIALLAAPAAAEILEFRNGRWLDGDAFVAGTRYSASTHRHARHRAGNVPRANIGALADGSETSFLVLDANPFECLSGVRTILLRVKGGMILPR